MCVVKAIFLTIFFLIFNGTNEAEVLDSQFSWSRGYWMIYRGPGFSRSYDLIPRPPRLFHSPVSSSTGDTQKDWERETTCWRERGWGMGVGEEFRIIYDLKEPWTSVNHSTLSELDHLQPPPPPSPNPLKGCSKRQGGGEGSPSKPIRMIHGLVEFNIFFFKKCATITEGKMALSSFFLFELQKERTCRRPTGNGGDLSLIIESFNYSIIYKRSSWIPLPRSPYDPGKSESPPSF